MMPPVVHSFHMPSHLASLRRRNPTPLLAAKALLAVRSLQQRQAVRMFIALLYFNINIGALAVAGSSRLCTCSSADG